VVERLTISQTSQLTLETIKNSSNFTRNYVIQLSDLENHVFLWFGPFLALIWPNLGQSGLKV